MRLGPRRKNLVKRLCQAWVVFLRLTPCLAVVCVPSHDGTIPTSHSRRRETGENACWHFPLSFFRLLFCSSLSCCPCSFFYGRAGLQRGEVDALTLPFPLLWTTLDTCHRLAPNSTASLVGHGGVSHSVFPRRWNVIGSSLRLETQSQESYGHGAVG